MIDLNHPLYVQSSHQFKWLLSQWGKVRDQAYSLFKFTAAIRRSREVSYLFNHTINTPHIFPLELISTTNLKNHSSLSSLILFVVQTNDINSFISLGFAEKVPKDCLFFVLIRIHVQKNPHVQDNSKLYIYKSTHMYI